MVDELFCLQHVLIFLIVKMDASGGGAREAPPAEHERDQAVTVGGGTDDAALVVASFDREFRSDDEEDGCRKRRPRSHSEANKRPRLAIQSLAVREHRGNA